MISNSTCAEESEQQEETNASRLEEADDSNALSPPFSAFSDAGKRAIACQASFSAVFSGLSSFVYYPAIRPLATSLGVSVEAINFTVSAYLIVAGIFPSIIGDIGDQTGRRPASLLAFTLYLSANLGIALQNNYAALVALRCVQSAGAAGTIAIAYGVIADIAAPEERGSYVGLLLGFTTSASCLGPVMGGIIAQKLSWRWIFWFLVILSGANLLSLIVFFPETCRILVGNGSLTPRSRINRSLYSLLRKGDDTAKKSAVRPEFNRIPNPLNCLPVLFQKPTLAIIVVGSMQYALCVTLGTSLSTVMADRYGLDYLASGLIFLSPGLGGLVASFVTGKLVDHDYRVIARSLQASASTTADSSRVPTRYRGDSSFPIEKARLRSVFPFVVIASLATAGYGWSLEYRTHIAVPLAMQFLTGSTQVSIFVICSTLLTDFNPNRSATAQASYNIVRCALAAAFVAVLEPLVKRIGMGWGFVLYAALGLLCVPLLLVLRIFGPKWRGGKIEGDVAESNPTA